MKLATVFLVVLAFPACKRAEAASLPPAARGLASLTVPAPPPPGLSPAEVLGFVQAADANLADEAKLAETHASTPAVRAFATTLRTDAEKAEGDRRALVDQLKQTPRDSAPSRTVDADDKRALADLRKKVGIAFDRAFLEDETRADDALVAAIDRDVAPATTGSVKDLVQKLRASAVSHRDRAKQLLAPLAH